MFLVFEWHTVTVALFHFNSSDTGVPTILLRPRTTALAPDMFIPLLKHHQIKLTKIILYNTTIQSFLKIWTPMAHVCKFSIYLNINSRTPFGVHGMNPLKSPIANLPSLIVCNLSKSKNPYVKNSSVSRFFIIIYRN